MLDDSTRVEIGPKVRCIDAEQDSMRAGIHGCEGMRAGIHGGEGMQSDDAVGLLVLVCRADMRGQGGHRGHRWRRGQRGLRGQGGLRGHRGHVGYVGSVGK